MPPGSPPGSPSIRSIEVGERPLQVDRAEVQVARVRVLPRGLGGAAIVGRQRGLERADRLRHQLQLRLAVGDVLSDGSRERGGRHRRRVGRRHGRSALRPRPGTR